MQINGDDIVSVGQYPGNPNFYVMGTPFDGSPDGREYVVPNDAANSGYQAVQAWVKAGGVILALTAPPAE